ncbi:uncharacterized protein GGS22DRAFT_33996 [Annulohypoxylon maeteangense]|uniref:uncharacterized protein n=1 Tax=Annulohypoxylon maeteangense TaxID=1927788 RepID=UPI0020088D2C|nr:uncharacterized protein GGS22DRAFT_33996 [Annulohypoxylon maeteangense]KAI0883640.1 hypothetical protein GGS22DRAFT_33996 [Annulohypoxylon maeteangense]
MGEGSVLFTLAPYQVLSYGTLLGTQVFHTFFNSIASFKVLERPQFAILQRAVFPIYFGIQTASPVVLALTYPGNKSGFGVPSSLVGVFHESNRWGVLVPLGSIFATGLLNLAYLLPETNKITALRREQEVKDGKASYDAKPHSKEMAELNKQFGKIHGISSLANLITLLATVIYGINLSSRLE